MHEGVISLQNYFFSLNRPIKNGINLFYLIGICAAFEKKSACNMLFLHERRLYSAWRCNMLVCFIVPNN